MSDWIKENKFAAAMLAVVLVAAVATYLFAGKKSEAYEEAKAEFDANSSQYSSLVRTEPFPNAANLEERREEIAAYRGQVAKLQDDLLKFRPETFEKIRPAELTTRIKEIGTRLKSLYEARGIVYPDGWQLGFETYTASPAPDEATNFLNYQLNAFDWLYQTLAQAGPTELINVHRPALPVEKGQPMVPEAEGRRGRARQETGQEPYFSLPVEITFKGPESTLRTFLASLANSKDYFFVVRSMRVRNTKAETPPKKSDANFKPEDAPAPADPFGVGEFDFGLPGDDADAGEGGDNAGEGDAGAGEGEDIFPVEDEPAAPVDDNDSSGEQILGRLLGNEEIHVFLQLELVYFRPNVELPEVK